MEIRLARRLMSKRPLGVILQVLALCLGFLVAGVALSLYGALSSHQVVIGAKCANQARWLSMQYADGYWKNRFTFAQARALNNVLGIPVYPVSVYKGAASVGNEPLAGVILGINADALKALCVSFSKGGLPEGGRNGALLGVSTNSDTIQVGTQDIPIAGYGTSFRGFNPHTDPAYVFLPLDTLARTGFDVKKLKIPVLRLFVSARTGGELPSDHELTQLVRSRPGMFAGVERVHLSHNLGHAGKADFILERYSRILGMLGVALLFLGLINVAAYQLGRQTDLGWRTKILRDVGAGPLALRRLAYFEPLIIVLGSLFLAMLFLVPVLRIVLFLLDMADLPARSGLTWLEVFTLLGVALVATVFLGELRYRAAALVRSRRAQRLIQGYFTYAGIMQTAVCVIVLALSMAAVARYIQASSGAPNYNVNHVRVYSVRLAKHHKPHGMAARWEGVLGPLGQQVHGTAAASLFLLPLPVSYGYASNGVTYNGHEVIARANNVTPGYFKVLQMQLVAGHMFGYESLPVRQRREGHVAIVNGKLAQALELGGHPANHLPLRMQSYIVTINGTETAKLHTIGVVHEGSSGNNDSSSQKSLGPDIYLPMPDFADRVAYYYLLVRYGKNVSIPQVDNLSTKAIMKLTPDAKIRWEKNLRTIYDSATRPERTLATLFGVLGFGTLSLVLCGIFGTGLFSLELHRRSLAVRFTMGATLQSLMWHHSRLVGIPLLIGTLIGLLTFAFFGRIDVAFLATPVLPTWATALLAAGIVLILVGLAVASTCRILRRTDFHEWLRTE